MRALFLAAVLLLIGPISAVFGQTPQFRAGISRIAVPAVTPFDVLVWYPTLAEEVPWQADRFTISASQNAAIAPGPFPIVLLSHGGGLTGGSPFLLRELSASLARQGFVVVAPFHGKARFPVRPLQVRLALDAVMADPRLTSHADPKRLGMLGFSLGGAVALRLAGAIPNMAQLASYCSAHPEDVRSCNNSPGGSGEGGAPRQSPPAGEMRLPSPLPLKAIALLDPFAALFQQEGLATVTMPVLLFRPTQSDLGEGNARGLTAALPRPPQVQTVPGGHFIFADVCSPAEQSAAPEICQDPQGVDRATVHAGIEARLAKFFRDNL